MSGFIRSTIDVSYPYTHSTGPVVGRALAALRDRRILGATCTGCGSVGVPAREWCERCGAPTGELVPVGPGGEARVVAPVAGHGGPTAWVLVRLDGAGTDLLHRGAADLRRGDRVHPAWRADRTGSIDDIERFVAGEPPSEPGSGDRNDDVLEVFHRAVHGTFTLSAGTVLSRFYADIRDGRGFNGTRCSACRRVLVPPRVVCPACWADTEGWIPVADRGTVEGFVVVNVPFHGQEMDLPYVLASILLDGADTTFLHVLGETDHTAVRTGMSVEAVWGPELAGFPNDDVRYFRPRRGVGGPGGPGGSGSPALR